VDAKLLWPNICYTTRTSTPAGFALASRAADAHRLAVGPGPGAVIAILAVLGPVACAAISPGYPLLEPLTLDRGA